MGESQKHNVKQKKQDEKIYTVWFHLYEVHKRQNRIKEVITVVFFGEDDWEMF